MPTTLMKCNKDNFSFASTLFLCPILDHLLAYVPDRWQAEVRLGLQEALVNAAKHGNNLDPTKQIIVNFYLWEDEYWWIIADEGGGFSPPGKYYPGLIDLLPELDAESGRGMSILHQIFDRVMWNHKGTEVCLCKQLDDREPQLSDDY